MGVGWWSKCASVLVSRRGREGRGGEEGGGFERGLGEMGWERAFVGERVYKAFSVFVEVEGGFGG